MRSFYEKIEMDDRDFRINSYLWSSIVNMVSAHPHWHREVEVLYFVKGSARQQVNDAYFTAVEGDIIIISKDQIHSTYMCGMDECEVLAIQFDADKLVDVMANKNEKNHPASFSTRFLFENPIKPGAPYYDMLLTCIWNIHKELEDKHEGYKYIVKSDVYKFTGLLMRAGNFKIEKISNYGVKSIHLMLENTFRLIDENYTEEISLDKAAAASNLSTTHFCRLFKKATGMTFNDYLMLNRVNRAEKLLITSDKITEIALECGFGSISSFLRSFKKYKNCTPSEFKSRHT